MLNKYKRYTKILIGIVVIAIFFAGGVFIGKKSVQQPALYDRIYFNKELGKPENFDFSLFVLNPLLLIGMLVLGFSVKFIGVFASRRFVSFSKKQLLLISWAMNSRGAIELALALIAFKALLIPKDIYSSIIVMALVTTAVFPFIITHMIKKDKRIMN